MFGRDSDDSADAGDQSHLAPVAGDTPAVSEPVAASPAPATDPNGGMPLPAPATDPASTAAPATSDMPTDYILTGGPAATDANSSPTPTTDRAPAASPATSNIPADLSAIKQQALQQLSPLVNHLELSPEEKFRTTMMMLQATDDQNLIKDAYAAAQGIPDDKSRAQALLDVVNEINYFSQHSN